MKLPRLKWRDIKLYQTFEITINNLSQAKSTYFDEFIVFKAFFDVGLQLHDYRECEISLPRYAFFEAYNATPVEWRDETGLMRLTIQKLRNGRMRIVTMGGWEFINGKWVNNENVIRD